MGISDDLRSVKYEEVYLKEYSNFKELIKSSGILIYTTSSGQTKRWMARHQLRYIGVNPLH